MYPDLIAYKAALYQHTSLSPMSRKSHLATVRMRYYRLLDSPDFKSELEARLSEVLQEDVAKQVLLEIIYSIRTAIFDDALYIEAEPKVSVNPRLTQAQANDLIRQPGLNTFVGIRDTAVIALMLVTGVRANEVNRLKVSDLRYISEEGVSLYVASTSASGKPRYVPYGHMEWMLALVEHWLEEAHITDGPLFRAFNKTTTNVRRSPLSIRSIELLVGNYPIVVDGKYTVITPMVLRRTYARQLYERGVTLNRIQNYLGVGPKAVFEYIGEQPDSAADTRVPSLYTLDVSTVKDGIEAGTLDRWEIEYHKWLKLSETENGKTSGGG
ncbi:MAG: tyrosine-type recombinase/integrase [Chloroflexi bacterium]|uniref:tyrosine-type recombinase/integrase n=1 Tax=Candidatus Flexifilum breve TaxID=3140694 RepID=UPI00313555ED|nr:tyrosine-type recombinase/integrase [Chloroflexota bacterium]